MCGTGSVVAGRVSQSEIETWYQLSEIEIETWYRLSQPLNLTQPGVQLVSTRENTVTSLRSEIHAKAVRRSGASQLMERARRTARVGPVFSTRRTSIGGYSQVVECAAGVSEEHT